VSTEPQDNQQQTYGSFLASARAAIAAELAKQDDARPLHTAVQEEIVSLLCERCGLAPEKPARISSALHDELLAMLREIALPYDFLGTAYLDYLSSEIAFDEAGTPVIQPAASRKASGSYYTPERIVKRIIAETLGRRLADAADAGAAADIRVLDPACGSGVFLLEAARELIRRHVELGVAEADAAATAVRQVGGADVSPEAAAIARLAFRLAGLPEPKIIVADSLRMTREHWREAFPAAFEREHGGFDVIAANPPYAAATSLAAAAKRFLSKHYEAYAGHGDLHYCFFELGLNLLRPGGLLGLLSSIYFIQASYAARLRKLLTETSRIISLIDCSGEALFPGASIHCAITILQKVQPPTGSTISIEGTDGIVEADAAPADSGQSAGGERPAFDFPQRLLGSAPWVIVSDAEKQWRARIERDAIPLGELCSIVQSPESGLNEAFALSALDARQQQIEPELLRPLIKNSDVRRYAIRYRDQVVIYVPRGTEIESYPAAMKHLEQFREQLVNRDVVRNSGQPWFAFHRPRNARLMNAPRKIVCPYRAEGNRFAVDELRALNDGGDLRMIFTRKGVSVDLYFLAALLNSRMLERYYRRIGRRKGHVLEYFKDSLQRLPMRILPAGHPLHSALADLSRLQHKTFSEQRDYLIERMILDLYELKAAAVRMKGRLF